VLLACRRIVGCPAPPPPEIELLRAALRQRGADVDLLRLPVIPGPGAELGLQLAGLRLLDPAESYGLPIDLLVSFGYPGYHLVHPRHVVILLELPPWWSGESSWTGDKGPTELSADDHERFRRLDLETLRQARRLFLPPDLPLDAAPLTRLPNRVDMPRLQGDDASIDYWQRMADELEGLP
jgi:hypothetical protein